MISSFFFFNDTATTEIYTLSLHDALPIYQSDALATFGASHGGTDLLTKHLSCSSRCNSPIEPAIAPIHQAKARSEEHTSELQSLAYLVCRLLLEKKKKNNNSTLVGRM